MVEKIKKLGDGLFTLNGAVAVSFRIYNLRSC